MFGKLQEAFELIPAYLYLAVVLIVKLFLYGFAVHVCVSLFESFAGIELSVPITNSLIGVGFALAIWRWCRSIDRA